MLSRIGMDRHGDTSGLPSASFIEDAEEGMVVVSHLLRKSVGESVTDIGRIPASIERGTPLNCAMRPFY